MGFRRLSACPHRPYSVASSIPSCACVESVSRFVVLPGRSSGPPNLWPVLAKNSEPTPTRLGHPIASKEISPDKDWATGHAIAEGIDFFLHWSPSGQSVEQSAQTLARCWLGCGAGHRGLTFLLCYFASIFN